MIIALDRVKCPLPSDFAQIELDAVEGGHRHMTRLAGEVASTPSVFHSIIACYSDGILAGIGAITDEPTPTSQPTWRMRRLYVSRQLRRRGIGRLIVEALLREAAGSDRLITVNAGSEAAACFWQAMGFRPSLNRPWSHEFIARRGAS